MSEQKRYTAQEMCEMAKSMTYGDDESSMEFVVAEVGDNLTLKESVDETNTVAAMLRQAADAEEEREVNDKVKWSADQSVRDERNRLIAENEQLKARLEAVAKNLENMRKYCAVAMVDTDDVDVILRAARGEGGAE